MTATARVREFTMGKATRDAYGEALLALGREHPEIYVLDADLAKSTKTAKFGEAFPDRFLNVGIAEANMVGIAAGLVSTGRTVFISSFAVFLMCKGFDQIRVGVSYSGFPVKLVASHGGISIGEDGPSQASVEDLALALALPGMTVCVPADEISARVLVHRAYEDPGAVYIRTGRPKVPIVHAEGADFHFGEAVLMQDGTDVTIIACGLLVAEALKAHDILAAEGISARVLDMHTLCPIDRAAIQAAADETGAVVVAEEHLLQGGLGSVVARELALTTPVPAEFVGVDNTYTESGTPDELLDVYGLRASNIVDAAQRAVARKG